ncbi:MAG: OsmC family protein [Cyclobacteriaceae bacterium]|nr:OsmC family protein [Cyclobacteriaceae bacterium]MDH4298412.1 OsmC family protein [Cyclobacteriaceae bacterium]MDH5250829.1 OsmC family protein [Cyclobacteriaceae bacterium]
MKIITRMMEDELYEASNLYGNKVSIDMRKSPEKKGQSPVELVLSSLAACGAVDIVTMLKKRKKTIHEFTIETDAIRQQWTPRWLTHIHCKYCITSPDVTQEELLKITKLSIEKYCSVASSLKSEITFSVEISRPR